MTKLEPNFVVKDGKVIFDAAKAEKRYPVNIQIKRKTSKKVRVKRR